MTPSLDRIRAWLPEVGSLAAYLLAGLLILIGVLLRFPLDQAAEAPLPPYITLYPAIVAAAFAGGIRVGMFAMVASAVSAWMLWLGPPSGAAMTVDRVMTGAVFLFTATITVVTSGLARLLLDRALESERLRAVATREAVHRIKNLIAVVQSLSHKISSNAGDVTTYRDRLDARLQALASAQDILLKRDWGEVRVHDLVRSTLAPFLANPKLDLRLDVDAVAPPEAVSSLSMALYELATNSMKYGALASPSGYVRLETRGSEDRYSIDWREIGLAHLAMGGSAGLGSALIKSALSSVEGSAVIYDLSPQAVACVFEWPMKPAV